VKRAQEAELKALLSGEVDGNDCYIEINAGAGGTESQDWASMLRRMYVRWANARGFKIEELDEHQGETAGIKSATMLIKGDSAYGWLKSESGVHRLVRISPYDSNARRHTSFASVSVSPVIDDTIVVDIQDKDVRTDTYRASGSGGQHINKTDSAVRLTHAPTGIVVAVQAERSQHKNRAKAMTMLRAKLYDAEKTRIDKARAAEGKDQIGSGDRSERIRTYNFPQGRVTDHRINLTLYNLPKVIEGEALGEIIDALITEHQAELLAAEGV
jgi:peptide chain release factor 2